MGFISDNAAGIHPDVLAKIREANQGHAVAYGDDPYTEQAARLFRRHFGEPVEVLFAMTGTAANVIALQSVMHSFEAVIAADDSHLHRDECGALEKFAGSKLLTAATRNGKVSVDTVKPLLRDTAMVHRVQPGVLSITQCTEWGTVYNPDEVRALADLCHENRILLHMDGARLCNAAVALDLSLKEITGDLGVDILSFGGTKNGLMAAEAVVFFNPEPARHAVFYRKQAMQLASKMRFVSAQFISLLEGDLWRGNAAHANAMIALLATELGDTVEIVMPVQTNSLFARLRPEWITKLKEFYAFAVWDTQSSVVRWMTAFDTKEQDVRDFAARIRETCRS